ncbi:MAG TPA: bifunctional adenosylcobinamide kinase/adenosylcobinamide-phosphate guanylyltransferase, partial [Candidatus Competibacter phosphatis]|nr:bifunctional adenosylcobinamide kinase/adenosylcobinamide-phosphate guanylyltransferase [Candidatus Competibacter phosphatis]HMR03575.1 bifunctional adenosylcobinamide kinase/adenosylcobinamide-phosphate guanylyltransferase [Candidatus Competibacter phosphatis]
AAAGLHVIYLATAQAGDAEMNERIAHHRADRPADWGLVEEPLALASALQTHAAPDRCLLVDCLTLWLSNLLAAGDDRLDAETRALLNTLPSLPGQVLLVSNEVGQGIVPINPLARRFRDEAGRLHQAVARLCGRVTLVVAGLPLTLKDCPA